MHNSPLLPSIRNDHFEIGALSSSCRQSILSYKFSSNIPLLKPKFSKSPQKPLQYPYITKATEILSSKPPSLSINHQFKYSRLSEHNSPRTKHLTSFLKPISISPHSPQVHPISFPEPYTTYKKTQRKMSKKRAHKLQSDRKTILSKISNYNISLGMSDSDSNYSEDGYCLETKLFD